MSCDTPQLYTTTFTVGVGLVDMKWPAENVKMVRDKGFT